MFLALGLDYCGTRPLEKQSCLISDLCSLLALKSKIVDPRKNLNDELICVFKDEAAEGSVFCLEIYKDFQAHHTNSSNR